MHYRHQDAVLPSLSGVSMERLDAWWAGHKEEVAAGLSAFALEVVTPGAILVRGITCPCSTMWLDT
jgi:hypothetical protein